MADAQARDAAIKQASHQVRTGSAFMRRASAAKTTLAANSKSSTKSPDSKSRASR
jgi:hypothetical protein